MKTLAGRNRMALILLLLAGLLSIMLMLLPLYRFSASVYTK